MTKRDIRIVEDKFIEPMIKSELCAYLLQYPLVKYIYKPETNQVITKMPRGEYPEVVSATQRMRIWDANGNALGFSKQR